MYGLGNCGDISELLSKLPEVKIHHISFGHLRKKNENCITKC